VLRRVRLRFLHLVQTIRVDLAPSFVSVLSSPSRLDLRWKRIFGSSYEIESQHLHEGALRAPALLQSIRAAVVAFPARCKFCDTPSPSLSQRVHRRQIRHPSAQNTEMAYFRLLGPRLL